MEFTSEQRKAIDTRGCNILVSAAAGSGKTGVLTERILSRLRQGDHIDEFLVLTFTRAAAGEMKKRIRDKIMTAAAECDASERDFWQKQLTLIGDAPITTIHSFCLRLLRRHYNLLPGLDPKFHMTDPKRSAILRDDLLSSFLEECYTEQDEVKRERFFDLLRLYGSRLSDNGLKKEILRLMDFGCSRGNPDVWLDAACRRFGDLDFWYEAAMNDARECIALLMKETLCDIELLEKRGGSVGCIETLKEDLCSLSELKAADWDGMIGASPFGRKKPRKKEDDPELDEYMKQRREKRKDYFVERVGGIFTQPFRDYAEEISELMSQMETLARMTKEFLHRYAEEKLKRSALDFDDLEIYALRLLSENPSLSREYQHFFKEVLVDEYQDINPLQDKILSYLAGEGRLFTVGDIKQSIYGFRLADHTLFHRRSSLYQKEEPNEHGLLIPLNKNFRSRKEVLSLTNSVFSGLMNRDVSGIAYGEDEALRFGAEYYKEKKDTFAEIVLVERPRGDADGDYENLSCHGRFVAQKIRQMMEEGFTVKDGDTERPLRYGDITVLMRSANANGEEVGTAISDMGIPVQIPSKMGFLSGRETKLIMSFLAVLDNPMQDIPLAAVMRSPLFSFDEDEL
ncbi:MAG: UvrD-helicase domain-containing protein, partial [Firmicutes bacterium]|nr:UvrD-helicase domain-containing protein [Bacillota bacterium]